MNNEPAGTDGGVRRYAGVPLRSPRRTPQINLLILIGIITLIVLGIYALFFTRPTVEAEVFSLTRSIEEIEELSTVRSHLRFAVVVREESGNIVVRELAASAGEMDMDDIGSVLFQDPTLIVALHAVATYGIDLGEAESWMRVEENDGEGRVVVDLPGAKLLDVKIVNSDTRVIARMQGLFRSENRELMLTASQKGELFATKEAEADRSSLTLANQRARSVIALLVESAGREVIFSNDDAKGREKE